MSKGFKVVDPECAHECQKWKTCVLKNWPFIFQQIWSGGEWDNKKKIIQFASIFVLLRKGKSIIDYEDCWLLFNFLKPKCFLKKTL